MEDLENIKLIFFTITTIITLSVYTLNSISGITILFKGARLLDPLYYMFIIMTTLSSSFTVIAAIDWLFYNQFMGISATSNLLWLFHHISHIAIIFAIHKYFYENYILNNMHKKLNENFKNINIW